jgi:hypothetical protein
MDDFRPRGRKMVFHLRPLLLQHHEKHLAILAAGEGVGKIFVYIHSPFPPSTAITDQ